MEPMGIHEGLRLGFRVSAKFRMQGTVLGPGLEFVGALC